MVGPTTTHDRRMIADAELYDENKKLRADMDKQWRHNKFLSEKVAELQSLTADTMDRWEAAIAERDELRQAIAAWSLGRVPQTDFAPLVALLRDEYGVTLPYHVILEIRVFETPDELGLSALIDLIPDDHWGLTP